MRSRLIHIENWETLAQKANYKARKLAEICKVCPIQLRRFTQWRTGTTTQKWLNTLRLRKAPQLMRRGQMVKEAASELGYSQPSQFSREFKLFYGMPPSTADHPAPRSSSLI
jgi:AraC-like DNA-binding protein